MVYRVKNFAEIHREDPNSHAGGVIKFVVNWQKQTYLFLIILLVYQLSSNFKATGVHLCFTMFMGLFRRLKVIQAWLASHVNTMYHLYGRGT